MRPILLIALLVLGAALADPVPPTFPNQYWFSYNATEVNDPNPPREHGSWYYDWTDKRERINRLEYDASFQESYIMLYSQVQRSSSP